MYDFKRDIAKPIRQFFIQMKIGSPSKKDNAAVPRRYIDLELDDNIEESTAHVKRCSSQVPKTNKLKGIVKVIDRKNEENVTIFSDENVKVDLKKHYDFDLKAKR